MMKCLIRGVVAVLFAIGVSVPIHARQDQSVELLDTTVDLLLSQSAEADGTVDLLLAQALVDTTVDLPFAQAVVDTTVDLPIVQDAVANTTVDLPIVQDAVANTTVDYLLAQQAAVDTQVELSEYLVPVLLNFGLDSSLSAKDGNYLAQNKLELQTYYDLGLSYQYIAEPYLRKQLNLPTDQGIIILSTDQSGEGHGNGFQHGDIVLLVDEEPVDTQYDFVIALSKDRGTQRSARIQRNGDVMDLIVVLSEPEIEENKRWIIGVWVDEISDVTRAQLGLEGGTAVTSTSEDGPAARVGVLEHDIITHIDGTLINSLEDLKEVVGTSNGKSLQLKMIRTGIEVTVDIKPVEVVTEEDFSSAFVQRLYRAQFETPTAVDLLVDFNAAAADETPEPEDRLKQLEQQVECLQEQVQELLDASKR